MAENVAKEEKRPTRPFSDKLVPSGLGRRFLALVLDVAIFIVPSYLLSAYAIMPAYTKRDGGSHYRMQEAYALMEETWLFPVSKSGDEYSSTEYYYLTDTGNKATPGEASYSMGDESSITTGEGYIDAYDFYHQIVHHYYTVFLPQGLEGGAHATDNKINNFIDSNGNAYTTVEQYYTFYYEQVLGLPKAETFNNTPVEERTELLNDCVFTYATDENNNAITNQQAVLRSSYQTGVDERTSTTLTTLNNYFFNRNSSSPTGLYAEACNNFVGSGSTKGVAQSFYSYAAGIYSSEAMAAFMFIYFPLLIIVEFIVPMCDKYGRTIGKWVFRLRVCRLLDSGEGILMTWWQRMMRCFYMTAILSPLGLITLAPILIGFIFMVSYFVLMMGKRHQSIHDMFIHTVVVNKKDSKIYENEEAIYDEKMEELAKERANLYRPPEILDLSTINSARDLARKYDRFDDIENEEVEVKTYTEYKKEDPADKDKGLEDEYFDAVDDDDEDYEDPLGLGDVGPQKKVDPTQVNLSKDDDQ